MVQLVMGFKLLMIVKGFDQDFDELYFKCLCCIYFGFMYSSVYIQQVGLLWQVLEQVNLFEGEDWVFVWIEEDFVVEWVEEVKFGWFGKVEW